MSDLYNVYPNDFATLLLNQARIMRALAWIGNGDAMTQVDIDDLERAAHNAEERAGKIARGQPSFYENIHPLEDA